MVMTILVPLDGSALAERALPYAIRLARGAQGWIVLLRVAVPSGTSFSSEQASLVAALEAEAERVRNHRIPVESCVCHAYGGDVAGGIAEAARDRRADLLVMATHARSGLDQLLHANVAEHVLQKVEVPVMVVPPACQEPWGEEHQLRILVPLDGSPLAEQALSGAERLAAALDAEVLLLQALEPPSGAKAVPDWMMAAARDYLETVARTMSVAGRSPRVRAEVGPAVPTITSVTRDEAIDVIAMASHGRTGLLRLALGSVAGAVLRDANVPLLLVRPTSSSAGGDSPADAARARGG